MEGPGQMRVVYCCHSLHRSGGIERILSYKANYLAEEFGYEVCIVTSHMKGRACAFPLSHSVKVVDVGVNPTVFPLRYRRKIGSVLEMLRPDVVVSMGTSEVYQLHRSAFKGPYVVEYHFPFDKLLLKYKGSLVARFRSWRLHRELLKYDKLVVLSRADLVRYGGGESVCQIYNPVVLGSPVVSDLSAERFLFVGRLSPEKHPEKAVEAWAAVVASHPSWKLDIYGDGVMKDELSALISSRGLSSSVRLCGVSSSLGAEFGTASGLVLCSDYEGFSLAAAEAATCGVPTVAFECPGGLAEVLDYGKAGVLVPMSAGVSGLASAVCSLISSPALRESVGAAALAYSASFKPSVVMGQWKELFESLVK